MWERIELEAAGSSASNQICLKTKSLPTNISSGAGCQLSAFHTCQSYLQTSISAPSFTGQLPIFVSADVSSAARQRPADVEPFALHAHVYLPLHPLPQPHHQPDRPPQSSSSFVKLDVPPAPRLQDSKCICINLFAQSSLHNRQTRQMS